MSPTVKRVTSSSLFGIKSGFIVLVIFSALAFLAAPVFFGIVLITASVVATVWVYTLIGFVLGFVYKFFTSRIVSIKKPEVPKSEPTGATSNG